MARTIMARAILVATMLLSGCATNWNNPNIHPAERERQFAIDDGRCTLVSTGSLPMPNARIYQPTPSTYGVSGTINTYDYGTNSYSTSQVRGTVSPQVSPYASFSNGIANGMAMGSMLATMNARKKAYRSCMLQLGWVEGGGSSMPTPARATVPASSYTSPLSNETPFPPTAPQGARVSPRPGYQEDQGIEQEIIRRTCIPIAETARAIMTYRQNDVRLKELMDRPIGHLTQEGPTGVDLYKSILISAYEIPFHSDRQQAQRAISAFENETFDGCKGAVQKNNRP